MRKDKVSGKAITAYVLMVVISLGVAAIGFKAGSDLTPAKSIDQKQNQLDQEVWDAVEELDKKERKANALRSARNLRAFRTHARQLRAEKARSNRSQ